MITDVGPTPYDKSEPVTLRFKRLEDGTLVAMHSHDGRSIAAIVHPHRESLREVSERHWTLAGDLSDTITRRGGQHPNGARSCAEAAQALADEMGLQLAGWSVESIDEANLRRRTNA